jgi:hypothetical protein
MLVLATHLLRSLGLFCVLIIFLVSRNLVCPRFVMPVNWLKVISFLIILPFIVLLCPLKLFILMFRVPLQFLLVVISIISVLLITLRNSHGSILWSIEPRLSTFFSNSKNMLSDSLTPKFDVFSPIGVGSTRNFTINFLFHLALLIMSLVPTLTNKMGPPNENTVTLLRRVLLY